MLVLILHSKLKGSISYWSHTKSSTHSIKIFVTNTIHKTLVRPHLGYRDIIYDHSDNACLAVTGTIKGTFFRKFE